VIVDLFRILHNSLKPLENYLSFSSSTIYGKKLDNKDEKGEMRQ
jgi:hypothetical protein